MSTDITSSEWDSLISDKKLVAADFWAPWCPYCKLLKPVFESIANEYDKSNIKFVKVNVDQEIDIATRYGIHGIPVIKFFCQNKEISEIVGYVPKETLKKQIENIIENTSDCLANTSIRR